MAKKASVEWQRAEWTEPIALLSIYVGSNAAELITLEMAKGRRYRESDFRDWAERGPALQRMTAEEARQIISTLAYLHLVEAERHRDKYQSEEDRLARPEVTR